MSSMTENRLNRKIIQIMSVPESMRVTAVYDDEGTELKQSIHIIGLFNNGDVMFLEPDNYGMFETPESMSNFRRYEIQTRESGSNG